MPSTTQALTLALNPIARSRAIASRCLIGSRPMRVQLKILSMCIPTSSELTYVVFITSTTSYVSRDSVASTGVPFALVAERPSNECSLRSGFTATMLWLSREKLERLGRAEQAGLLKRVSDAYASLGVKRVAVVVAGGPGGPSSVMRPLVWRRKHTK